MCDTPRKTSLNILFYTTAAKAIGQRKIFLPFYQLVNGFGKPKCTLSQKKNNRYLKNPSMVKPFKKDNKC